MKIYVSRMQVNSKGTFIEGFRYKKLSDKEYQGLYCKYYLKGTILSTDDVNINSPVQVGYDEVSKTFVVINSTPKE